MILQTPLAGHGSNPLAPPPVVPPVACPPVAEEPPEEPPAEPALPALPPLDVPAVLGAPPLFVFPPRLGLPALPALPPLGAAPPEFAPPGPALPPFAVVPPLATLPPLELPARGAEPPLPAFESVGDDEHATRSATSGDQRVERDARFMTIFKTEGPPRPLHVPCFFVTAFDDVTLNVARD
jgi:hypothetical protein